MNLTGPTCCPDLKVQVGSSPQPTDDPLYNPQDHRLVRARVRHHPLDDLW